MIALEQPISTTKLGLWIKRLAVVAFILYTISIGYAIASILLGTETPHWMLTSTTLVFFAFAVLHAAEQLGMRSMLVFLGITIIISFLFETVGVLTGLIYGPYYYTNKLGPKLGVVPALIPIAWFMMNYASYAIVRAIVGEKRGRSLLWLVWISVLAAMAMTAWDLGMDPQMTARGHWIWTAGGAYFGIPVHNFVGWLATTFVVYFLYHVYEVTQPARGWEFDNTFALLPLATYALQGIATIIAADALNQRAPAMITFFAMGAFLFAAITRILPPGDQR